MIQHISSYSVFHCFYLHIICFSILLFHYRNHMLYSRFGTLNRLGSSQKVGPSPNPTPNSLHSTPPSASTKDTIPTPSSTKSLSFSLSYLGSRSFSSSSPSSGLRGVNGNGQDFSPINITPSTPALGDQSCNASNVGSTTSFSLKDLDLEVTSSIRSVNINATITNEVIELPLCSEYFTTNDLILISFSCSFSFPLYDMIHSQWFCRHF